MIHSALEIASFVLMAAGAFFVFAGSVGVLRFPDFYSRLHAAGITDTLGADLILVGLMLQAGMTLLTVKLFFVVFFFTLTSPASTHAIANAAKRAGLSAFLVMPRGTAPEREGSGSDTAGHEGQTLSDDL